MALNLRSEAFNDGGRIPDRFARVHANVSPPLEWSGEPDGTESFALLVEDPDAPDGTFRHWAVYDISSDKHRLEEGAGRRGSELKQDSNDFGDAAYDGPEPPEGHGPHSYNFRLAALDVPHLNIGPQQRASDLWQTVKPHVLEEATLTGVYER